MKFLSDLPLLTNEIESANTTPFAVSSNSGNHVKTSPMVREASFEDHPQIAELQSRYGLEYKSFDQWKHLWCNNPAYREREAEFPIGWVLEGEQKEIVGYLGNIPLFYEIHRRQLLASVAHSWVVDLQYRTYALLLLEKYFSQKNVDVFLNATVGPAASESFAVFQSLEVPVGEWNRSRFWITNYRGFLEGWLAMKGRRSFKPVTYALSVGLYLKQAFFDLAFSGNPNRVELRLCEQIDDRFDVFWQRLRQRSSHVLRAVRNREFLNWHFQHALREGAVWILAGCNNSEIHTYAIFMRQDSPRYGLKRVRLIDFQSIDDSTALLLPMLAWALKRCHREGIHMLECIGFRADKQSVIAKAAPYERNLPSWLYFYKVEDRDIAEMLSDPNAWDPSQFDGDASL